MPGPAGHAGITGRLWLIVRWHHVTPIPGNTERRRVSESFKKKQKYNNYKQIMLSVEGEASALWLRRSLGTGTIGVTNAWAWQQAEVQKQLLEESHYMWKERLCDSDGHRHHHWGQAEVQLWTTLSMEGEADALWLIWIQSPSVSQTPRLPCRSTTTTTSGSRLSMEEEANALCSDSPQMVTSARLPPLLQGGPASMYNQCLTWQP